MIKTILITGLDGCGKSTIFSKLKEEKNDAYGLITLPHIDTSWLDEKSESFFYCNELNRMNADADENQKSELKALALFGSMLLFSPLAKMHEAKDKKYIICERHPLIDTKVYAKFYASKLNPQLMENEKLEYFQKEYGLLLNHLKDKLPLQKENNSSAYQLFDFIYTNYGGSEFNDHTFENTSYPDKIYFLKASPEVLYARISTRKNPEPHENIQVLTLLDSAYSQLLQSTENNKTEVMIVDASGFEKLDEFYSTLLEEIKK